MRAPWAMCARLSLLSWKTTSFCSRIASAGSLGKRIASSSAALVRAEVARGVARPRLRDVAAEVRQAPADGEAEPGRSRRKAAVDRPQRLLEPALRVEQGGLRPADPQPRGHELMVERRDDDLDAVVGDHRHVHQEVLLGRNAPPRPQWPRGRAGRACRRARTGRRRQGLRLRFCRGSPCASRHRARANPSRRGPADSPAPAAQSGASYAFGGSQSSEDVVPPSTHVHSIFW